MSEVKGQQEPSMEEILASIRRIIAEDNDAPTGAVEHENVASPPAAHAEPPAPVEEDVLDLTDILDPPPPPPAPVAAVEPVTVRKPEPAPMTEQPPLSNGRLISEAAAASSSAAFASLARRKAPSELPFGNGALTLEQMVRELVTPMLRDWLDTNLPPLVERLVREEVERLAREGL